MTRSSGGIIISDTQFIFDLFGRRIAIINDADGAGPAFAVRENLVYFGNNVWADYNTAGEAVSRYLFGDSIDSNIARWRISGGTAWYLTDHLGTVRGIADAIGMLANQTTYDSFGQVLNETNSQIGDRYRFAGRELNSGSDYYYRARTYDANAGRFTSNDPLGIVAGDSNFSRFVRNAPTNSIDPTGTESIFYAIDAFIGNALIFGLELILSSSLSPTLIFGVIEFYLIYQTFKSAKGGPPAAASDVININPADPSAVAAPFQVNQTFAPKFIDNSLNNSVREMRDVGVGN